MITQNNMTLHNISDDGQVDKRSLIIFPAVSILFNAGYWTVYLVIMPNFIQYGIPE